MSGIMETRGIELSDATFDLFRKLIHQETGIFMRDSKKMLVTNRIRKRLTVLGLSSFEEYYALLTSKNAALKGEKAFFIDAVSTNETYFFRGDSHFDALRGIILPEIFARKSSLRVWSAGCSTGEEPYTVCMVIMDAAEGRWKGTLQITATDINTDVVRRAREGIYSGRTLARVPQDQLEKHFEPVDADSWRVAGRIKEKVTFSVHNLLKDEPPGRGFDIIFCRNVMIYFEKETQIHLVDGSFASAIDPKGYLLIGHSESLIGKSERFRYAQVMKSPIYRPVDKGEIDA